MPRSALLRFVFSDCSASGFCSTRESVDDDRCCHRTALVAPLGFGLTWTCRVACALPRQRVRKVRRPPRDPPEEGAQRPAARRPPRCKASECRSVRRAKFRSAEAARTVLSGMPPLTRSRSRESVATENPLIPEGIALRPAGCCHPGSMRSWMLAETRIVCPLDFGKPKSDGPGDAAGLATEGCTCRSVCTAGILRLVRPARRLA